MIMVTSSAANNNNNKLPFSQIEALHVRLLTILDISSDRRAKACQKLKPNPFIEDQVRAFAVADEKVICPITGALISKNEARNGWQIIIPSSRYSKRIHQAKVASLWTSKESPSCWRSMTMHNILPSPSPGNMIIWRVYDTI